MSFSLNILCLEPFYGGSHRTFLELWTKQSRHRWKLKTLEPKCWKWRTRSSAIQFAMNVQNSEKPDLIFCTSMVNTTELRGLLPPSWRQLPIIVYFHENQLSYPLPPNKVRQSEAYLHDFKSAIGADKIWWNSQYNQNDMIANLQKFFKGMPDKLNHDFIDNHITNIIEQSSIQPPAISVEPGAYRKPAGPLHIVWAARWEHDKNPKQFFHSLERLKQNGYEFKISVLGEEASTMKQFFLEQKELFSEHILNWGFQPRKEDYLNILKSADVIVSTAKHEFFGISVMEAAACNCYPVLPNSLSYPELFRHPNGEIIDDFFFNCRAKGLIQKLQKLIKMKKVNPDITSHLMTQPYQVAQRYHTSTRVGEMDNLIESQYSEMK